MRNCPIHCPQCGHDHNHAANAEKLTDSIRRYRTCLGCGFVFRTIETLLPSTPRRGKVRAPAKAKGCGSIPAPA